VEWKLLQDREERGLFAVLFSGKPNRGFWFRFWVRVAYNAFDVGEYGIAGSRSDGRHRRSSVSDSALLRFAWR